MCSNDFYPMQQCIALRSLENYISIFLCLLQCLESAALFPFLYLSRKCIYISLLRQEEKGPTHNKIVWCSAEKHFYSLSEGFMKPCMELL